MTREENHMPEQSGEIEVPAVGTLWRKNDNDWKPLPGEGRHVVRVEGYTPLGRPILRRVESQHEFIHDLDTLTRAYDPCEPHTMVWYDAHGAKTHQEFPWRTFCIDCGWSDTFDYRSTAEEWAKSHDEKHAEADVFGSSKHPNKEPQ